MARSKRSVATADQLLQCQRRGVCDEGTAVICAVALKPVHHFQRVAAHRAQTHHPQAVQMERWYGTLRGRGAPLRRRTRCWSGIAPRHRGRIGLLVSLYTFVKLPKSLRQGRTRRTPAMAIGLTDHVWS